MKFSNSLNVLLLGSGGREHAFARKIAESPSVAKLFIAPGNAGTAQCGTNVDINPNNFGSVKQFVLSNNINLVVVGPEEPLVRGIYDFFCEDSQISNIPVIARRWKARAWKEARISPRPSWHATAYLQPGTRVLTKISSPKPKPSSTRSRLPTC